MAIRQRFSDFLDLLENDALDDHLDGEEDLLSAAVQIIGTGSAWQTNDGFMRLVLMSGSVIGLYPDDPQMPRLVPVLARALAIGYVFREREYQRAIQTEDVGV